MALGARLRPVPFASALAVAPALALLCLSGCQVQPRQAASPTAHDPVERTSSERRWWDRPPVVEDLQPLDALAFAVRTVVEELEETERARVLAPYWRFGPPRLHCAIPQEGAAPPEPAGLWQPQEIYLRERLALLEVEWGGQAYALAALFVGPEPVAKVKRRLRKPPAQVTLEDVRRRLRAKDRAKLEPAVRALDRAALHALAWPVDRKFRVTSLFGPRIHPVTGLEKPHRGIDVAVPEGTPIHAPAPGVVRQAREGRANGLWVEVDHGGGVRTQYLHLSAFVVKRGQKVSAGELLGYSGATGRVTGPHLHYQLVRSREHLDPLSVRVSRELARQPFTRPVPPPPPTPERFVALLDRAASAEDLRTPLCRSAAQAYLR